MQAQGGEMGFAGSRVIRRTMRGALPAAALGLALAIGAATPAAATVQTFYIAIPEEEFRLYANAQTVLAENETQTSVVSITATFNGTTIYYDQWEDGYEYDITAPTQSTTRIWGDGLAATGCPPTTACGVCTDACDVINAGNVITLQNNVPVTAGVRDRGNHYYDGRDKIAATEQLVVTHAMWPSSGVAAQLGGAVEVFDTGRWGTLYDIPLGNNLGALPPAGFNWVALSIMAQKDGTIVQIDVDGVAGYETSTTLNEGQTYFSATTVRRGSRVQSNQPVQVNMLTCESTSTYNGRLYPLLPTSSWGNLYYSPVPSTVRPPATAVPAYVILFNPHATATVEVSATTGSGTTTHNVPPRQTFTYTMPQNTAARFQSTGANAGYPFYAVEAVDSGNVHNWGFTLLPRESLTTSVVAGWSPGTTDRSYNASPLWVTPDAATTVYVDYDGDPSTGPNTIAVAGLPGLVHYDVSYALGALQSQRIFSPGPAGFYDHTGYRLFTVDNTKIAVVWGQDGSVSSSGAPLELDLGTTLIPYPTLTAYKDWTLVGDFNGNGGIDEGEVIQYSIRVYNSGIVPINTVTLTDALDAQVTYVANTSLLDGSPVDDDAVGTRFPFDAPGYNLPLPGGDLLPGQSAVVSFQATVNAGASGEIFNNVKTEWVAEIFLNSVASLVQQGALQVTKTSSAPALGRDLNGGDTVDYTITVSNVGSRDQTGIKLDDPLPAGSSYVPESTMVTGFRERLVRDNFDAIAYTNNDGPQSWAGGWFESDGTQSATAGNVLVSLGELRLQSTNSWARRPVDLSAFTGGHAYLSLDWRTSPTVVAGDQLQIQVATASGGPWTTLRTLTGVSGQSSGSLGFDISGHISASTYVRLNVSGGAAGRYFYADKVQVRAVGATTDLAADDFSLGTFAGGSGWTMAAWGESDRRGLGPGAGNLRVTGGQLTFNLRDAASNDALWRGFFFTTASIAPTLRFDFTYTAVVAGDTVAVELCRSAGVDGSPGTAASNCTLLENLTGYAGTTGVAIPRAYGLTAVTPGTYFLQFRNVAGANGRSYNFDNVRILQGRHLPLTRDNIPGGANPDLASGVPPLQVQPQDGFALSPGESMTLTYRIGVNTPPNVTRLVNTVTATSWEKSPPSTATTVDPVSAGGAIGERVWLDGDANGLFDVTEQGLVNVRIWVDTDGNGSYDAGTDFETRTSALGTYTFGGLPPNACYRVHVDGTTVPAGLTLTAGTSPSGCQAITTANEHITTVNFGYRPTPGTAVLGNFVWSDADSDGAQDPGEIGLSGVRMRLSTSNGADNKPCTADDILGAVAVTGPDGTYLFTGVAPGVTYRVCADVGANDIPGDGDGVLVGFTPTAGPQSAGNLWSFPTTPAANQVVTDVDFGFVNPAYRSVSDRIWFDANSNGVQDTGESGLAGVTVNLLNVGDTVRGSTLTGANGNFSFSGLPNGTYTIRIEDIYGKLAGFSGTTAYALAGLRSVTVSGSNISNVSFGYNAPGSIGDTIWNDDNSNRVLDPGETGISGVTVELYEDTDGNGLLNGPDLLLDTAATDIYGNYRFQVSVAGRYFASVPPSQFNPGGPLDGFTRTTLDDDPAAGDQVRIDLYSLLTSDLTADFGYRNPSRNAITGRVFYDLNENGTREDPPEAGLAGVTLDLLDAAGTTVLATTATLADGTYRFSGLTAGTYQVRVTDTSQFLDGFNQTRPASPPPVLTVVLAGVDSTDNDFGFFKRATRVFVSSFSAEPVSGGVLVRWETAAENGTAGFFLVRLDRGFPVPVNTAIVPALLESTAGGAYAVLDPGASGSQLTYRLIEVLKRGGTVSYGPFTVRPRPRTAARGKAAAGGDEVAGHATSADGSLVAEIPAGMSYGRKARQSPAGGRDRAASRAASRAATAADQRHPSKGTAGEKVRIAVDRDGIHRVGAAEIAPLLGVSADRARKLIAAGKLSLSRNSGAVSYLPVNGGSSLLFFGQAADTPFTGESVYWLASGAGDMVQTATVGAAQPAQHERLFVDTARAGENRMPDTAGATDPAADYWMWDYLVAGDASEGRKSYPLSVPGAAGDGTATLVVNLRGATDTAADPEHHAIVRVNGTAVGEATWNGLSTLALSCSVPEGLLSGGDVSVEIEAVLDGGVAYSVFYLDSLEISYHRRYRAVDDVLAFHGDGNAEVTVSGFSSADLAVFDLSRPDAPRILGGVVVAGGDGDHSVSFRPASADTPYLAVSAAGLAAVRGMSAWTSSALSNPRNAADYLIITGRDLRGAAESLAHHRRLQGLSVRVATVDAIMDEFNAGVFDPEAIRGFLAYARRSWATPPRYVLLAGDGSADYRDHLGHGGCIVPPAMVATPYGLFASDTWYADADGDRVPEFAVGRLPAKSESELQAMIDKIIAHETDTAAPATAVLFAADQPDDAGDFTADSDALLELVPAGSPRSTAYLAERSLTDARRHLQSRVNAGLFLVNYIGHAGYDRLADEGLLLSADVAALSSGTRQPLFAILSCIAGSFSDPGYVNLGEELVLRSGGGAAAVFGPTGPTLNVRSALLGAEFLKALYGGGSPRLGDVALKAMQAYGEAYGGDGTLDLYGIIGDPGLVLR